MCRQSRKRRDKTVSLARQTEAEVGGRTVSTTKDVGIEAMGGKGAGGLLNRFGFVRRDGSDRSRRQWFRDKEGANTVVAETKVKMAGTTGRVTFRSTDHITAAVAAKVESPSHMI